MRQAVGELLALQQDYLVLFHASCSTSHSNYGASLAYAMPSHCMMPVLSLLSCLCSCCRCTWLSAEQVLQVLWKAQPDEAAKQEMPYKGRAAVLFSDDPYYELAPDTSGRKWIQLKIAQIKGLLNY